MREYKEIGKLGDGLRIFGFCSIKNPYNSKEFSYKSLWDTGNSWCCISSNVVKALSLEAVEECIVVIDGKTSTRKVYAIDLTIGDIAFMNVLATEYNSPHFDVNIGMEIIKLGDFRLSCNKGFYELEFKCEQDVYEDCCQLLYDK